MTNNPIHFTSDIIGYYVTHAETVIAANTPVQQSAPGDSNQLSGV